jgi:serine/threonine protein kinase/tetratricopeptide (TPR) repeat protein
MISIAKRGCICYDLLMICPSCAAVNDEQNRACSGCHAPLPPAAPEARGAILGGRFRVLRSLGRGGMGEILLAEDVKLGRRVAVKSISGGVLSECDSRARFLREAQAASRLEHPNICTIYEIAEEGGREFIVMQFVDGVTLDQLLKMKPLSLGQIRDIAAQVVEGMIAAQKQNIVHRDIKPGNIMIDRSGQVKILDFGLAKICSGPDSDLGNADAAAERRDHDLTEKGIVLGTVSYMSPEQAKGLKLDGRSDVFSFGVLLYEMLENRNPFLEDENIVTLYNILHREVQFSRPAPEALRAIIRCCLQKDRNRRYRDFSEIRQALAALNAAAPRIGQPDANNETEVIDTRERADSLRASGLELPASDGEHLSEMVRRLKSMKASTEALRTTAWPRWLRVAAAVLVPAVVILLGLVFLRPSRSAKGNVPAKPPPVQLLVLPFENQTPDKRVAAEVHFLVQEALNQSAGFKALDWETLIELEGGRPIRSEHLKALGGKYGIHYVLSGKLSSVADKYNIEASLSRLGESAGRSPFFFPGKERDSLLTDQVDNLARRVRQEVGGGKATDAVTLATMYGSDWQAFDLFYQGLALWNRKQFGPARQFLLRATRVPAARFHLAQLADYTGAAGEAQAQLKELAPLLPGFGQPLRLRVQALEAKFNFDFQSQVRCLRQLREMFPFSKDGIFELGEAYFRRGDADRAIPEFTAALALDRHYAPALNHLGYCYSYQGRHQQAIECFERYRDIDRTANSFDSLGDGYFYLGDYTQAENSKVYAVSLDNSMDWPYLTIADIHILKADFPEAARSLAAYRKLASYPKAHADALAKEAAMRLLENDHAAALDLIDQALARHDSANITDHSAEYHWLKGLCRLARRERPQAAAELHWLRKLCDGYRLSQDNFDAALKFRLHLEARIAEDEGQPERAREAFRSLLAMQTQLSFWITYYCYPYFLNEYAGFLLRRGELAAAGEAIERCLAFNPSYPPALWSRVALRKSQKDRRYRDDLKTIAAIYGQGDARNPLRDKLARELKDST